MQSTRIGVMCIWDQEVCCCSYGIYSFTFSCCKMAGDSQAYSNFIIYCMNSSCITETRMME